CGAPSVRLGDGSVVANVLTRLAKGMTSAASLSRDGVRRRAAGEGLDTGSQAAPPFWQRIGPRVVALVALIPPAAAVFLTQHRHSRCAFRHKLTETQPTTRYAIETTATKAAPAVN